MGMSIDLKILYSIYPINTTTNMLEKDLCELEAAYFFRPSETPENWIFTQVHNPKHLILRK